MAVDRGWAVGDADREEFAGWVEPHLAAMAALAARLAGSAIRGQCVDFVGLTVTETAAVLEVADGTVKSALSDARARLRAALEVTG